MRRARPDIHERAKRHLSAAIAFGWKAESMCCDYAENALVAEGYSRDKASDAVTLAWDNHFRIYPPV
jgi:hypothetical protein